MIAATLIKMEEFRSADQLKSFVFSFPTVAALAESGDVSFELASPEGKIVGLKILNSSTLFDISVRDKSAIGVYGTNALEELLRTENINKMYQEQDLNLLYTNDDTVEGNLLYMVLNNRDAINATGTNLVEFLIAQM